MDERRDGQTDAQTDADDFTGPCPTNVELPKPLAVTKNFTSKKKSHKIRIILENSDELCLALSLPCKRGRQSEIS